MQYVKYLNIPYKYRGATKEGLDCIGLCQMIAQDNDIIIGNINYDNIPLDLVSNVFDINMNNQAKYKEVEPKEHALIVFRVMGKIQHIGYMISKDKFLHIMEGTRVSLESIYSPVWAKRIVGYYEYIGK